MTTVAIVDDHRIFCDSLAALVSDMDGFSIIWTAQSGSEAIKKLAEKLQVPDILLLDVNMPAVSGLDVAEWIFTNQVNTRMLVLTMEEDDTSIIKMLHYGARGYLLKMISGQEFQFALEQVRSIGYHYTPMVVSQIGKSIRKKTDSSIELKGREQEILELMATDMSYSEIAAKAFLSESTIDTYRARLFQLFEVKNRIGLILKAHTLGLIKL